MIIYVVSGETGEYSDWSTWSVAAYADKEQAQKHAALAQARADELHACRDEWRYKYYGQKMPEKYINQYDRSGRMDYTGNRYGVEAIAVVVAGKAEDWPTNEQVLLDELREAGEIP